jgi:NADH dehydrogenase
VGVRPDPLVDAMGLPTTNGRIDVDEWLTAQGREDVFAAGDIAAVPDLTRPGQVTPMTAQHAQHQGRIAGINAAASLGWGLRIPYRHRDRGFIVDLGGAQAVADPLHIPISGLPAKTLARAYHLLNIPANKPRVLADWLVDACTSRQIVHFGLIPETGVTLASADPPVPRPQ